MKNRRFPRKVACVYCGGGTRAGRKPEPENMTDCNAALGTDGDTHLACVYGCLGHGSCVAVCKFGAIRLNEHGVAEIDAEKCIHCGLCVKACPRGIIRIRLYDAPMVALCSNHDKGSEARKLCSVSCIACKICEKSCPCDAIVVQDDCAAIDDEACLVCGKCVTKCPRKLIIDVRGIVLS